MICEFYCDNQRSYAQRSIEGGRDSHSIFPTKGNSWLNYTDPVITRSAGHAGASERDCGAQDRPRARLLARSRIGNMHYYGTLAPARPRRAAWCVTLTAAVACLPRVWCELPGDHSGQLSGIMTQERPTPEYSPSTIIFISDTPGLHQSHSAGMFPVFVHGMCRFFQQPTEFVSWILNISIVWNITELYFFQEMLTSVWNLLNCYCSRTATQTKNKVKKGC